MSIRDNEPRAGTLSDPMTPPTGDSLLSIASAITSIGFAAWLGYHMITKTIPKMDAEHQATIEKIITTHSQLTTAARLDHKEEFRMARADFKAEIAFERQHCIEEQRLTDQRWAEVAKLLTTRIVMNEKAIRDSDGTPT